MLTPSVYDYCFLLQNEMAMKLKECQTKTA